MVLPKKRGRNMPKVINVISLNEETEFRAFERNYDDLIFYADGEKNPCINALKEENQLDNATIFYLDGWYVAILEPNLITLTSKTCLHEYNGKTCEDLYTCCDCGNDDNGCGCSYCWSCNACDNCKSSN